MGISSRHYRALAEFRYQIRRFLYFSERAAQAAGIEPQQHQLLLVVKAFTASHDGPTIGYIAERLQVRHHSAVELVDRLESTGAIKRQAGAEDKREVWIRLTAAGRALLGKLAVAHRNELKKSGPELARALQLVVRQGRTAA